MKPIKSKKLRSKKSKFTGPKWVMFGLVMGVVLATVGSVAALNGWFGGGSSIPEDTMTRGLVGYWGFEEGSGTQTYDASNYANHGVLTNGPKWGGSTTTCKVGGCLTFDGNNDYVEIADSDNLDVGAEENSMTVEAWVYLYTDKSSEIVAKAGQYWFEMKGNTTIEMLFYDGTAIVRASSNSGVITTREWIHLVAIKDGTTGKIYRNGVDETSSSETLDDITTTANNVYIGSYNAASDYLEGLIDEVRIYNRALSAEEIRYHYNRGGPVAHWKFDEGSGGGSGTVYDSTENDNDGTLILGNSGNIATSSAWVSGKYGTALSFDGVDDYVDAGSGAQITGNITLEAWAKTSISASNQMVVSRWKDTGNNRGYLLTLMADDSLVFQISQLGTDYDKKAQSAAGVVTLNQWNHLVGRYDGSTLKVFLNGIEKASTNYTQGIYAAAANINIGTYDSFTTYFNGIIDDVRIYNYARTPEEIRLDYNAGFAAHFGPKSSCSRDPGSCMTEGLVGYWGFEEGSGTKAYDASDYANNGALYYMTTSTNAWTSGKVGGALEFDGTDDYVEVSNTASLDLGSDDFTIEAWVRFDSFYNWVRFLNKSTSNYQGILINAGAAGTIHFLASDTGSSWPINITSASTFSTDTWYHIVALRSGSDFILYVNASNEGSGTASMTLPNHDVNIGRSTYLTTNFDGLIDEVRIYNRALSAEEIRYHYNRGGPVGHWKFDEGSGGGSGTVYDSTENDNDGTLILGNSGNIATSSAWVSGKYGTALSFDGVDDYVDAGSGAQITGSITVAAWVKPLSSVSQVVASRWKDTGDNRGYLLLVNSDESFKFQVSQLGTDYDKKAQSAASVVTLNQWNHLVGRYDGSTLKVFLNGIEKASTNYTQGIYAATANINIGTYDSIGSFYFDGIIDDVRIYNYARTPEEIRLDYNAGFAAHFGPKSSCSRDPGSCMTEGLVGYWNLEEGSGSKVYDASDYANNGTTSAIIWSTGIVPLSGDKGGGSAIEFDGTDLVSIVDPGSNSALDITEEITLEAWFYPTSYNNWDRIVAKPHASGAPYNMYGLNLTDDNDGLEGVGFAVAISGVAQSVTASNLAPLNTWTHTIGTYDGSQVKIYINGVLEDSLAVTGDIDTNNEWVYIGYNALAPTSGQNFTGSIDEVRIYNRALSVEEIRYHYNRGGPVGHWKFDEGSGGGSGTVYDSTENDNDGTLILGNSGNIATSSAWVSGKYGTALSFDGTDDYVDVGTNIANSNLPLGDNMTFEMWIKGGTQTTGLKHTLNKVWAIRFGIRDNSYFETGVYNDTGGIISDVKTAAGTYVANAWTHVVYTHDTSNDKLYINGLLSKSETSSFTTVMEENANTLSISDGSDGFNGIIDDVRIYNYARTAEQIRQDYNAGLSAHFK